MSDGMISSDDREQLVEAFLTEADETLNRLEELLLQLEQSRDDDLLHEIFRAAHTVKGSAACLQLDELTGLAHATEELLERMRVGEVQATPACINRLLDAVDALRDLAARSVAGDRTLTVAQPKLVDDLTAFASAEPLSAAAPGAASFAPAATSLHRALRVAATKLDRMLDLTGEIAISRGHLREQIQVLSDGRERALDTLYELDRLNLELQELIMHARLVPLAPALRPFHRVVRDLAAREGKRVTFVIDCGDVEVDTAVVENLKDPVTHMIRNAIDHGIETPEVRAASGKPPVGTIRIAAAQENGAIVLRFSDDGSGIDEQQISRRARSLGMDTDRLTRQEVLSLIFEPGFTTAKKVTDVSGRGVGMDIVRRNVETLRGSVTVSSEAGRGTTVTLRLPLTIAVIEGFGVRVADDTYVFPMESVVECAELPATAAPDVRGVLNVRGEPLPYLRLRQFFGFGATAARQNVVVVQTDAGRAGIVVDELLGSHQTVMKPMKGQLRRLPGIAGSSILGSGRVALIIDVPELLREATTASARIN